MRWRLWSRRTDADFAREIQGDLDLETRRLMDAGMSEEEAQWAARRAFGNLTAARERFHESQRLAWLSDLGNDLHYGLRSLRRNPIFAAAAILSLGFGIGATAAIFNLVDAFLLRPLPVTSPQQLYFLRRDFPSPLGGYGGFWVRPDLRAYQRLNVFAGVAGEVGLARSTVRISGVQSQADPTPVSINLVSGNYFATMGVHPSLGRLFTEADDQVAGGHPIAVISDRYWGRAFSRDQRVLGRALSLNGTQYTIVGVTAPGFGGDWVGRSTDIWIPLAMHSVATSSPPPDVFTVDRMIARLGRDVSPVEAQAALDNTAPPLARDNLAANPHAPDWLVKQIRQRVVLAPAAQGYSPQRAKLSQPLKILMAMVSLILLVASANVANLLMARATARQQELAVRRSLGAGAGRIARQLFTETLLLSGFGILLGLVIAVWAAQLVMEFLGTAAGGSTGAAYAIGLGSLKLNVGVDLRLLVFTAGLGLATTLLCGLAPAVRSAAAPFISSLRQRGAAAGSTPGRFALIRTLVAGQVALSLVLLIGTGLLVRSLHRLRAQDLGYARDRTLLVWTEPGLTGRSNQQLIALADAVDRRLVEVPGVVSAAATSTGLLTGVDGSLYGTSASVNLEGQAPRAGLHTARSVVTPGFFAAAGIPLLAGRDFAAWDTVGAPLVVIVNEAFARLAFGGLGAVGRHVGWLGDLGTPRTIIGVARDAKQNTLRDREMGFIYIPYHQRPAELANMCIVLHTSVEPRSVIDRVRETIANVDPTLTVVGVETISEQMDVTLVGERLVTMLGEAIGGFALLLAAVGLYGVVAYTVGRRTNEFGVRLALGATARQLVAMVLQESLWLVLVGVVLGAAASVMATRIIASQLFDVGPFDPPTTAAAAGVMVAVATIACLIPALRATRLDPIATLRAD